MDHLNIRVCISIEIAGPPQLGSVVHRQCLELEDREIGGGEENVLSLCFVSLPFPFVPSWHWAASQSATDQLRRYSPDPLDVGRARLTLGRFPLQLVNAPGILRHREPAGAAEAAVRLEPAADTLLPDQAGRIGVIGRRAPIAPGAVEHVVGPAQQCPARVEHHQA